MLSQIFLGVDTGHASTVFIYYADDDVFNQTFLAYLDASLSLTDPFVAGVKELHERSTSSF